jgi:opacity protein-like surface antigen
MTSIRSIYHMKSRILIITTLLLSAALPALAGSVSSTAEQPISTDHEASPWGCRIMLYGWAQAVSGDTGIRGVTVPVDSSFSDILKNLDIAAMGTLEVDYKRWSFIADGVYASVSDSKVGRFGGVADLATEQFLGNFLVAYETVKTDTVKLDLFAGARVNSVNLDLDYTGPKGNSFSASSRQAWVDPLIGARFQSELPHDFFFRALADVGGFGVSSQFTWQLVAGFGYHLTDHSSILLGYRAIGTDYTNAGYTYDVVTSGIVLGGQYSF